MSDTAKVREIILAHPRDEEQVVHFIKRSNGKLRMMRLKTELPEGSVKGEGGNGRTYDPAEHGLLTVWDLEKDAIRAVPLDAVTYVEQNGRPAYVDSMPPEKREAWKVLEAEKAEIEKLIQAAKDACKPLEEASKVNALQDLLKLVEKVESLTVT